MRGAEAAEAICLTSKYTRKSFKHPTNCTARDQVHQVLDNKNGMIMGDFNTMVLKCKN